MDPRKNPRFGQAGDNGSSSRGGPNSVSGQDPDGWTTVVNRRAPKQNVLPGGVDPKLLNIANYHFGNMFANSAYTSLMMLKFWIWTRGITYEQYVSNPHCLLDQDDYNAYVERSRQDGDLDPAGHEFPNTRRWLWQFHDDVFMPLIHTGTGRCTSFAIQAADTIQSQHRGSFDFVYYRMGNHYLARCKKTGIVIDSSCKKGAFVLPEGEGIGVVSSDERWICTWTFQGPEISRYQKRPRNQNNRSLVC